MSNQVNFEQLANVMGDGVVISDAKGDIVFWNAAAERIFGYSSSEALGKSLDIITPERFRERHWDGYKKSMDILIEKNMAVDKNMPIEKKKRIQLLKGYS